MLTTAHVGHWLAELMYVLPVLAVVVWISIRAILDRRAAAKQEGGEPPSASEPAPR